MFNIWLFTALFQCETNHKNNKNNTILYKVLSKCSQLYLHAIFVPFCRAKFFFVSWNSQQFYWIIMFLSDQESIYHTVFILFHHQGNVNFYTTVETFLFTSYKVYAYSYYLPPHTQCSSTEGDRDGVTTRAARVRLRLAVSLEQAPPMSLSHWSDASL